MGMIVLAGALTGSNLPDIDTSIQIVKHRGFTHTFWFVGIASVASSVFIYITATYIPLGTVIRYTQSTQIVMSILFGGSVGLGVITHLLGDVITPTGIKPYHPVTPRDTLPVSISEKKYVYEIAKASNKKYNIGFSILGVLSASISAVIGITFLFNGSMS
jgi:inner membrane protein